MVVIDTNVLVRLLVRDDGEQADRAHALFERETVLVTMTVLLETEWVLRNGYRLRREAVLAHLRDACALASTRLEAPDRVLVALDLAEAGFDFADALHCAATAPDQRFATFDKALIRLANLTDGPAAFEP